MVSDSSPPSHLLGPLLAICTL